jgi:hypothetical protein
MPLHVAIKVRDRFIDQLIISDGTIPSMSVVPESLSGATYDYASVWSRDQVVVILRIKADAVRVDQEGGLGTFGGLDVASDASYRHYAIAVLW